MSQENIFNIDNSDSIYEDQELIEMIDINTSSDKIKNLRIKFKQKLIFLEDMYNKKYLEKKQKIDSQLNIKKREIENSELDYLNTKKYYDDELDNIRFHDDLIKINKNLLNLTNQKNDVTKKKNILLEKRKLDNFYIYSNKAIIEKNTNIVNNNLEFIELNNNLESEIKKINDEYENKVKTIHTNLEECELSITNLINDKEQQIKLCVDDYERNKNKINDDINNLNNKVKQFEVNNKKDNVKKLQNDKYILDIQLNNKKIKLLDKQLFENKKKINDKYLLNLQAINIKKNSLNCQIEENNSEQRIKVKNKIKIVENYKKYYKLINDENNKLHNKNILLDENVNFFNKDIINIDLELNKINFNIKEIDIDKKNKTIKICKEYKYKLNIYEDDLYDKKVKINKLKNSLNYLESRNIYDKDLEYVKKKIILYQKYLYN